MSVWARQTPFPYVQVWRILFWAMAGLAIATCILAGLMGVEPRRYLPKKEKEALLPGVPHQALHD